MLYQLSYASKFGGKDAPSRKLIPQIPARCPGQLFKVSQGQVWAQPAGLRLPQYESSYRRHPDRSRFSGGAKDLARRPATAAGDTPREIPRPAGKNAGLRDDAGV